MLNQDRVVCSDNGTRGYTFWERYLKVFDSVKVLGRLAKGNGPVMAPVEGPGVTFAALTNYVGPLQYLCHRNELKKQVREICSSDSAFIARVPGAIGNLLVQEARKMNKPYGLEVVGDPYDLFAPGAVHHPLRPLIRLKFYRILKAQCQGAAAATYVTEHTLQRRYPCPGFTAAASSVELPDEAFADAPRTPKPAGRRMRIISVGSLAQPYKANDVLIDALAECVGKDLDLELAIVGDGRYRADLEKQTAELGITDRVIFMGSLPAGEAVRAELMKSDLFAIPSRTEGLPRALIEAMACALPCIGSKVGGIPELLPEEDMTPPGNAAPLAGKILEVLTDPERMADMSSRNLERSHFYHSDKLTLRRNEFYSYLRELTERNIA